MMKSMFKLAKSLVCALREKVLNFSQELRTRWPEFDAKARSVWETIMSMQSVKEQAADPRNQRRRMIRIMAIIFFVLIFWASVSEIDQTTRAQGQVIPLSRSQIIQSFDGGVLEEMMVREGDPVNKDQVLAKLNPTRMQSTYL